MVAVVALEWGVGGERGQRSWRYSSPLPPNSARCPPRGASSLHAPHHTKAYFSVQLDQLDYFPFMWSHHFGLIIKKVVHQLWSWTTSI